MTDIHPELFDLSISKKAEPLLSAVKKHIAKNVIPWVDEYHELRKNNEDPWSYHPRQLELIEQAKQKARDAGLWNFFLPNAKTGEGLSNLDYAYIAVELGKTPLASQTLNCAAPDTGNMEVLERVGTPEQKEQWLKPLLEGKIRSAYAMTEPDVASSDATNIQTSAVLDGDEWLINGQKYYISGAGDPRCKVLITMVKTSPDAETFRQQSQNLNH
jgi:acyl-CoA dehydrogenase